VDVQEMKLLDYCHADIIYILFFFLEVYSLNDHVSQSIAVR